MYFCEGLRNIAISFCVVIKCFYVIALYSVVVVELIVYGKYTEHCNILACFGRCILVSYKKTTLWFVLGVAFKAYKKGSERLSWINPCEVYCETCNVWCRMYIINVLTILLRFFHYTNGKRFVLLKLISDLE